PGAVAELYRQGRQAVAAAPALAAPRLLTDVARNEARLLPDQSLADFAAAFQLALALPAPLGADDAAGQARLRLKQEVELNAVSALAELGEQERALELVRQADVPKGPLYDLLVMLADRTPAEFSRRGAPAPARQAALDAAAGQAAMDRVFALVQECKRSDGSYPYHGVATLLRRPGFHGLERLSLVRDGYQWAAGETVASQISAATMFLQAGHQSEPALDGELEPVLLTLLRRAGQAANSSAVSGIARSSGNRLMALLQQLDPAQAQRLALELPGVGAQALAQTPFSIAVDDAFDQASNGAAPTLVVDVNSPAGRRGTVVVNFGPRGPGASVSTMQFNTSVTALAPDPAEISSGGMQFQVLLAKAESLQRQDPGQALSDANQAADLLDDTLLANETVAATRLATVLSQLGASADASRLLARCLGAAERQAAAADASFFAADAAQQAQTVLALDSAQAAVLEVYSLAARVDFATTAARAADGNFVLLKPLVLSRLALVGEVGQRPAVFVRRVGR
ncbi:MAG: hypothetical protein ACRD1E_04775, partial [Terriglobales bacterium]